MSIRRNKTDRLRKRKVFIVDEHVLLRESLVRFISLEPDLAVCGHAVNPLTALKSITTAKPHIVLLDIAFEGLNGIAFISNLKACHPKLPVLVYSVHNNTIFADEALKAGADGYISKRATPDSLLAAIRRLL